MAEVTILPQSDRKGCLYSRESRVGVLKSELHPGVMRAARFVLLPWRAGWALANRLGWLGEAPVGSSPHMDPAALGRWREALGRAKVYLEYGSGGSTVEAARAGAHVVSVDNDRSFMAAVAGKVLQIPGAEGRFKPIYIDVGWTEKWGRPLNEVRSSANIARWRRYTEAPWEYLKANSLGPDLVLVDGRFRVACVLETLLRLPDGSDCTVIFDDFAQRQRTYEAVLKFADADRVGRALVLRRKSPFDREGCARALRTYQADPE
jgi:hypothetical protein